MSVHHKLPLPTRSLAAALATTLLPLACATAVAAQTPPSTATWSMYQDSPGHDAVFPGPAQGYTWSFPTRGKIVSGLSVVGGTVFAASFDHRVYALDAATGKLEWSAVTGNVIMSDPIVARDIVVVGTGTNDVLVATPTQTRWGNPHGDAEYGIDASTGKTLWIHRTVGEDMPSPALVGDLLVFGNGNDVVQALNLFTGKPVWRTPVQGVTTMSSAAAWHHTVYLVAGESPISSLKPPVFTYALDAETGKILWKAPYGDADCSPTLGASMVFVEGSTTIRGVAPPKNTVNTVTALDAATGARVWAYTSPRGALIHHGEQAAAGMFSAGVLYQALPEENQFLAFSAATGKVLWRVNTRAPVKMSAVLWHHRLLFGDVKGDFYTVDAGTGKVLAVRKFPQGFSSSSPVVVGATLAVASGTTVYAMPVERLAAATR